MKIPQSLAACLIGLATGVATAAEPLSRIRVADDARGFVAADTGRPFVPWGFNYDHNRDGTLLEDYWTTDWPQVADDFQEMRALGANIVRIHLQFARFCPEPNTVNRESLERLADLLALAERTGLYLDLTGLGCYHKRDVPAWYDALDEPARWQAQAFFWEAVARACANRPAVFCYDLMNEPVVPGGQRQDRDWLGPPFAGKHFVQFITLDQADRPRPEIARAWVEQLVAAIRKHDPQTLTTIGLVDWSLDRPGLTSGFVPREIAAPLDVLSVHIYPEGRSPDAALETLAGFAVGKPVLVEEIFPLKCSVDVLEQFIDNGRDKSAGWIGFYWGKTRDECRASDQLADKITLAWLDWFATHGPPRP